jgi:flagellar protein FlaE
MSINPRDYDLDELRRMARERGDDADDADVELGITDETPAPNSFRAGLYRELLPLEAGSDASKPYLSSLPDKYAGENLIFEWLEFLLLHAGYQGATDALDYYESVGWITDDVESDLNDYLLGIESATANENNDLDIDDHLLSLVYVAKLASMQ